MIYLHIILAVMLCYACYRWWCEWRRNEWDAAVYWRQKNRIEELEDDNAKLRAALGDRE